MSKLEEQTVIRLPAGTGERADQLISPMNEDESSLAMGKITRSTVIRMAILEGLKVLEKRYKKSSK